jgi:DHA1 family bicyclomycin/chloramphenicol resistance-like MFS transporter
MREPQSRGYTLALTVAFGVLTAYIASVQQIVFDAFQSPQLIGLVFAAVAAPMALASWTNSRIVGRFGVRRIGHAGAFAFAAVTIAHAIVAWAGYESLAVFVMLQGVAMACFAFTSSNLSTLAMEHMGPIAGTAASVQGVVATMGGAAIGFAIGQSFDGTVNPFLWGVAGSAVLALVLVILTEPRQLFAPLTRAEEGEVAELPPRPPEDLG